MSAITPYKTTFGSLLNVKPVEQLLHRYLASVSLDELAYGYLKDGARLVFITGVTVEEQELPIWNHPLVLISNRTKEKLVCVDLRRLIRKTDTPPTRLTDIAKNIPQLDGLLLRTLLTADYLVGNQGLHRNLAVPMATIFGLLVSNSIATIITMDPLEKANVETIVNFYYHTMSYEVAELQERKSSVIARLTNTKLSIRLSHKEISALVNRIDIVEPTIDTLASYIKAVLPEEKADFITADILINTLSLSVMGQPENCVIALEHQPTFISLVMSVVTDSSYKRSRLATLITKNKRVIDTKTVVQHFVNFTKPVIDRL